MAYLAFIRWGLLAAIAVGLLLVAFGYCLDAWDKRRDIPARVPENSAVRLSPAEELLVAPVRELERLLPNLMKTHEQEQGGDREK